MICSFIYWDWLLYRLMIDLKSAFLEWSCTSGSLQTSSSDIFYFISLIFIFIVRVIDQDKVKIIDVRDHRFNSSLFSPSSQSDHPTVSPSDLLRPTEKIFLFLFKYDYPLIPFQSIYSLLCRGCSVKKKNGHHQFKSPNVVVTDLIFLIILLNCPDRYHCRWKQTLQIGHRPVDRSDGCRRRAWVFYGHLWMFRRVFLRGYS